MAGEVDHSRFELVFGDDFAGDALDTARWIDHYLPHWTTPERSAARYALNGHGLELLIEADQQAWRPEDGELRVSNLQTGSFSGPAGSPLGQHRHRRDLQVRSPQPSRRLWTPSEGLVEVAARASSDPTCMLAFWLIGFEEASPQESGEVCIAELYGNAIEPYHSQVRLGIKAHHDPNLRDEMTDVTLSLDARDEHSYATEWNSRRVRFFVDDQLVCTVEQGLDYPLQLMIDLFEFPATAERDPANYPKTAHLTAVRGYQPR